MPKLSKSEKKKRCSGCRSNRYNMGVGYQESSNDAVVTCDECWSLASARPIKYGLVYYSPSQVEMSIRENTLSCWHTGCGGIRPCDKNGKKI